MNPEDSRTIRPPHAPPPPLRVEAWDGPRPIGVWYVMADACIGREEGCELRLDHPSVKGIHAQLRRVGGRWILVSLAGTRGLLRGGRPAASVPIDGPTLAALGRGGPTLRIGPVSAEAPADPEADHTVRLGIGASTAPPSSVEQMSARSSHPPSPSSSSQRPAFLDEGVTDFLRRLTQAPDAEEGTLARFMRQVTTRVADEERRSSGRRLRWVLAVALAVVAASSGITGWSYHQVRSLAQQDFYRMKQLELELATLGQDADARRLKAQRRAAAEAYEAKAGQLSRVHLFRTREERLIHETARALGECDAVMPEAFVEEVKIYIARWLKHGGWKRSMGRALKAGHARQVQAELAKAGLPAQLLYLPLVESDYRPEAYGDNTSYGIAKGLWQLMPPTARDYGLRTGPLEAERVFDPEDERHDVALSAEAAVKHLKWLYRTRARASGLLVMAAYNWGHVPVERKVEAMERFLEPTAEGPEGRNFWTLMEMGEAVPEETYNYVFRIVSAAVIGADPAYFGVELER